MNNQSLRVNQKDLSMKLLPLLIGRVFHITTLRSYASICADNLIRSNKNGKYEFTFSQSKISYFRNRGCISVFDLRSVTKVELEDALSKYYFLNPSFTFNNPIFLFLNLVCFDKLLPWSLWKEDKAFNQMVIPYVEAGYPCDIPLSLIDMVIKVEVDNTPSTLELAISARKETQS